MIDGIGQNTCHKIPVENPRISTTFGVTPLASQDIVE
jgi:hypothetical protein